MSILEENREKISADIANYCTEYARYIPHRPFRSFAKISEGTTTSWFSYGDDFKQVRCVEDLDLDLPYENDPSRLLSEIASKLSDLKNKKNHAAYGLEMIFDSSGTCEFDILYPDYAFQTLGKEHTKFGKGNFYLGYIYTNITEHLISQLDKYELNSMIYHHIEEARKTLDFDSDVEYTKSISDAFYLMMVNQRITSEIEHGAIDYFFECFEDIPVSFFEDFHASMTLLENTTWITFFSDLLATYALDYPNVKASCLTLNITPNENDVEKRETLKHDLQERFYNCPDMDEIRANYIKSHPEKFTQTVIDI